MDMIARYLERRAKMATSQASDAGTLEGYLGSKPGGEKPSGL
jgi:hypothetical protein